jgi:hypothetical protein
MPADLFRGGSKWVGQSPRQGSSSNRQWPRNNRDEVQSSELSMWPSIPLTDEDNEELFDHLPAPVEDQPVAPPAS